MRLFLLLLSAMAIAACGDSGSNQDGPDSSTTEPPRTGFTSCGSEQCQPGQYCLNAAGGFCEAGCLSDVNCASNQECVKENGDAAGSCQNVVTTPREDVTNPPADTSAPDTSTTPDTSTPRPENCEAVCNKGFECGLFSARLAAECTEVCEEVPEAFDVVANCVHLAQCGPSLPGCYDMECGGSYGCPAGETCDEDFGTCD